MPFNRFAVVGLATCEVVFSLLYCIFIQYIYSMATNAFMTPQPVAATGPKLLLNMCTWKVPAGFPSPAADHTQKRIDLNDHLIRN